MEVRTEHPYIVQVDTVCGGQPSIQGTRIPVWLIAKLFKAGVSADEIAAAYPHLKPAAIYDAISYYLDHQEQIEKEFAPVSAEQLGKEYGFEIDERGFVRFKIVDDAG